MIPPRDLGDLGHYVMDDVFGGEYNEDRDHNTSVSCVHGFWVRLK